MENLHPGAKWMFRIIFYIFLVVSSTFLFMFLLLVGTILKISLPLIIILYLFISIFFIIISEVFVRLSYNNWKYEIGNTEVKIEKGIIFKVYKSIPYNRVQNIEIRRGILARIFGFSTLDIQTAGYSGGYYNNRGFHMPEGQIPAIDIARAEEIRKLILKKITKKNSGL